MQWAGRRLPPKQNGKKLLEERIIYYSPGNGPITGIFLANFCDVNCTCINCIKEWKDRPSTMVMVIPHLLEVIWMGPARTERWIWLEMFKNGCSIGKAIHTLINHPIEIQPDPNRIYRELRGGSWNDSLDWLRAASRISASAPSDSYYFMGFRCVR